MTKKSDALPRGIKEPARLSPCTPQYSPFPPGLLGFLVAQVILQSDSLKIYIYITSDQFYVTLRCTCYPSDILRFSCTYSGNGGRLGTFPLAAGLGRQVSVVQLNVALEVFGTFKFDATLGTPQAATGPLVHLLRRQPRGLSVGAPGHASRAQPVGKAVHIQLYQVLLIPELLQAQRTLVEFLQGLAVGR